MNSRIQGSTTSSQSGYSESFETVILSNKTADQHDQTDKIAVDNDE